MVTDWPGVHKVSKDLEKKRIRRNSNIVNLMKITKSYTFLMTTLREPMMMKPGLGMTELMKQKLNRAEKA